MTYKESYMKCETLEDLMKEDKSDIATAYIINPDKIQVIKKAFEEVANLKFKDKDIEKFNWDNMEV